MMWLTIFLSLNLFASTAKNEVSIPQRDSKQMVVLLMRDSKRLSNPNLLISESDRLQHWLSLGRAFAEQGHIRKASEAWRNALIINPKLSLPQRLNPKSTNAWLQVQHAVEALPVYPLVLPDNGHFFAYFVNGKTITAPVSLKQGEHFFQIRCGDGRIQGVSLAWPNPIPWRNMCGLPSSKLLDSSHSALIRRSKHANRRLWGAASLTIGSLVVAAAAGMHQLWLTPRYEDVLVARSNPSGLNRMQADVLTDDFLRAQTWTGTALISGAVLIGLGSALQWPGSEER